MSKVFIDESTLTGIADAIRDKEGSNEKIPPLEMPERIEAISGGVNYLDYCQNFNIWSLNLFGTPIVELTLQRATSLNYAFCVNKSASDTEGRRNVTVEELIVHNSNTVDNMNMAFGQNNYYADTTLRKIVMNFDTASNTWANCFNNLQALEYIEGIPINFTLINTDSRASNMFGSCKALIEVRFKGSLSVSLEMKHSTKLSKDSIISLMACLSDETTDKTLTLSQTAVDAAFETSEGAADGSSSAEWTALVESKSNWTISLV